MLRPCAGIEWRLSRGDALAQFALGVMYANGEGVAEDDAEAVRWYRMATEQGLAGAQFALGVMYLAGEGVVQDDLRGYLWFSFAAAASQGDVLAFIVGTLKALSPADRVAVQRLAAQCQASGFKDCGEPE